MRLIRIAHRLSLRAVFTPAALLLCATTPRLSAGPNPPAQPLPSQIRPAPEISAGLGLITGLSNPNDYLKLPATAAVHFPVSALRAPLLGPFELSLTGGLLHETILRGVETRHTALQTGARIRLGPVGAPLRPFADLRGGAGLTDSGGAPHGQGQDFCFNAWVLLGAELRPSPRSDNLALWAGLLYTHVSNGGLSEPERPNEGLDSLGAALGAVWRF